MEQKTNKELGEEKLIRILSKDIPGKMTVYSGLTRIKGISWGFSNALCKNLKIDKNKLSGDENFTVSVDITNTGQSEGAEVAQLYIQDVESSVE